MNQPLTKKRGDRLLVLSPAHLRAKQWFIQTGTSVKEWARTHNFPAPLVYRVLSGRDVRRGMSHDIAVLLGIKVGTLRKDVKKDGSKT